LDEHTQAALPTTTFNHGSSVHLAIHWPRNRNSSEDVTVVTHA